MDTATVSRWAIEHVSRETAELELWRRWMRWMCRENLYFLCVEVLGLRRLGKFHVEQCRRINRWPVNEKFNPFPYMADFWPRGWFKTTIATEARIIQTILRCPEECILVEHGNQDDAAAIVTNIKAKFESNVLLNWLFPDILWGKKTSAAREWTKQAFTIKRVGDYKAPTLSCGSVEAPVTGGHFTLIICDDLVYEGNIGTRDNLDKTYEHFKKLSFLHDIRRIRRGDPDWRPWMPEELFIPFRIAIVATRWDIHDANSRIIDPGNSAFAGIVDVNIQPAEVDPGSPDVISRFPEEWPPERLMAERRKSAYNYSAQMNQDPYPAEECIFNPSDLQTWNERTIPSDLAYFSGVDMNNPPENPTSQGDFGVVMTIGVSNIGNIYIMKIDRKRFMPHEQVMVMIDHWKLFQSRRIAVEDVNYQKVFRFDAEKTANEMGLPRLPLVPMKKTRSNQKTVRIKAIEPTWSRKQIFYNPNLPNHDKFLDEAMRWRARKADQDDMLDTLVDCLQIHSVPRLRLAKFEDDLEPEEGGIDLLALVGVKAGRSGSMRTHGRWIAKERLRARRHSG